MTNAVLTTAQVDSVAAMKHAMTEMADALAAKANGLRAAVNDLDNHAADVSPLEVMNIMFVHNVRITETDRRLHAAVQAAAHAVLTGTPVLSVDDAVPALAA